MKEPLPLTTAQLNKASKLLRAWFNFKVNTDEVLPQYDLLLRYRVVHQLPLTKATMGLRSMVATEKCKGGGISAPQASADHS